jgi:hypothetical protein
VQLFLRKKCQKIRGKVLNYFSKFNKFSYDKSAANPCHQGAALVIDMFCYFYLLKNHKIVNNSTTAKAGEINKCRFGILKMIEIFRHVCLTKFKNNKILLNKIRFILAI